MKIYYPTLDLKTRGPISFDMINANLRPDHIDLIYLRFIDLKVEKTIDEIFVASIVSVLCRLQGRYSYIRKFT